MSILRDFKQAQLDIKSERSIVVGFPQRLELHGYWAQGELGDNTQPEPKTDIVVHKQKWLEHNKHRGMPKEEAMQMYIELVAKILKRKRRVTAPLPPLSYPQTRLATFRAPSGVLEPRARAKADKLPKPEASINSSTLPKGKAKAGKENNVSAGTIPSVLQSDASRKRPHASLRKLEAARLKEQHLKAMKSEASFATVDDNPVVPPLPPIDKPTIAIQDEAVRQEMFRSRHFSSIAGTVNPMNEHEDLEKKFMLYEKLRAFYAVHDPNRIKKGLGAIVEWTMVHGEDKLNENLRTKYKSDLDMNEQRQSKKVAAKRKEQRAKTRAQLALSQRLIHTKDVTTRKKMDKLTRFLLVNDPELVSHGMFLMMKFIENKGLGALNENLKKNYGKSLDSVSDDDLNTELKRKYGNDLGMLDKPLFTGEDEYRKPSVDAESVVKESLQEQMLHIDREKLREEASRQHRGPQVAPKRPAEPSFDDKPYKETFATPKNKASHQEFKENKELLRKFLEIYEPYRLNEAFELIGNYMKRYGLKEVNKKLKKKYDVDLSNFQTIDISTQEMTEDEFNIRVLQFVTKHEKPKNVERAITAMTAYKRKQGIAALNTKLFMKYGQTLNDVEEEVEEEVDESRMSMAELHKFDLPIDLKDKLKIFYTKYDPTILAGGARGIERIFEWTENNGPAALDKQLKAKYQESLTEFCDEYDLLNKQLIAFYQVIDIKKLESKQLDTVLSWAMVNGRDALNYNLRKKYDRDLNSFARDSSYLGTSTLSGSQNLDL